jgi:AraC-like DNA-binding protein
MKLFIKNMVCDRCKATVKNELDKMNIHYIYVELGEANITERITSRQHTLLSEALHAKGFELIDEEKNSLIEKLKKTIAELEKYSDEDMKISFMDYISLSLSDNFISLNTLFSEIEGTTIEKYIIRQKIEKVKELLVYEDYTLAEIAIKLHYSSVIQLSNQFKRITGLTPSYFKLLRQTRIKNPQIN